jgi:hypothetical protein
VIRGSCLCSGVKFEIDRATAPFELCHCSRCRKSSGSAFVAGIGVQTADFRLISGRDLIVSYEAPILDRPPAYRTTFCRRCGSPVPDPLSDESWFEVATGTLDDDPGIRPDKHIFVEFVPAWSEICDPLPQLDKRALIKLRISQRQNEHEPDR